MPPAARMGDMHTCPMATPGTPPVPHVGGPILPPCAPTVLIGGVPAARVTDMCTCVGPPDAIAKGSPTVTISGLLAARMGDLTVHGGVISVGLPTVMIGEVGMGSAGGGGGGAGGGSGGGGSGGGGGGSAPAGAQLVGMIGNMPVYKMPDGTLKVGKSIIIKGDKAFQDKVLADLAKINSTPTGAKLMKSIDDSGKTMTIQPLDPGDTGNATGYTNGADRFAKADGTPGPGTDSTIFYDPDTTNIGPDPWGTRPPAIGLAHEMIHGDQAAHGTQVDGTTNNDNKPDPTDPTKIEQEKTREVEAAGIPPNDTRDVHENKIRDEWTPKQPQRQWY